MKTFTMHSDPGHGWLEVSIQEARQALLDTSDFSQFSFMRGEKLYLEEDCDLSRLIGALTERGITPTFVEHHTNNRSPIRSYEVYRP